MFQRFNNSLPHTFCNNILIVNTDFSENLGRFSSESDLIVRNVITQDGKTVMSKAIYNLLQISDVMLFQPRISSEVST